MNKKGAQMEDYRDDEDWYAREVMPARYETAPMVTVSLGGGTE